MLIVGGVAGEFILEGFVSQADGLVQSFDNIRLAETQRGAARAIVDAGWANERAAAANTETAELLAEIQPRHLTKEQYDAISDGLKPFSGRGFFIGSYWVDAEAARLARQIKTAINRAGLGTRNELLRTSTIDRIGQYPEIITGMFGGGGVPTRMPIIVGIQVWGTDREVVETFTSLMRSTRLGDVIVRAWPKETTTFPDLFNGASLSVFVGSKPIPEAQ